MPAMSVAPWMFEWPRSALTPPPARPTLPISSCSIAAARMICVPKRVLRPADRVDDRGGLLHVAVLADGGEEVGGLEELILRDPGDALDHLRRVARILLLQQLEDATRMLQRQVVHDVRAAWRRLRSRRPAA